MDDENQIIFSEVVRRIVTNSLDTAIGDNAYQHSRVNNWTNSVMEQCLGQLSNLQKPLKYIVNCIIMQNNGAGLQTAASCFWDNSTDEICTVKWQNKSVHCIVTVFGLAI